MRILPYNVVLAINGRRGYGRIIRISNRKYSAAQLLNP